MSHLHVSARSLLDYLSRGEDPGLGAGRAGRRAPVREHERRLPGLAKVALQAHRGNVGSVDLLLLRLGLLWLGLDEAVADEVVEEGVVLLVDRLAVLGGDEVEDRAGTSLLAVGGCGGSLCEDSKLNAIRP